MKPDEPVSDGNCLSLGRRRIHIHMHVTEPGLHRTWTPQNLDSTEPGLHRTWTPQSKRAFLMLLFVPNASNTNPHVDPVDFSQDDVSVWTQTHFRFFLVDLVLNVSRVWTEVRVRPDDLELGQLELGQLELGLHLTSAPQIHHLDFISAERGLLRTLHRYAIYMNQ